MSPRRRLLLAGSVAVLVLLVVALALRETATSSTTAGVPQDRPGPVVLIPGYGGGTVGLDVLAARLQAAGRQAVVVRLPGEARGDLGEQADAVDEVVRGALDAGAPSVDLIGFSAGGVVARVWFDRHDGEDVARRIVTLGSPHHGTGLAGLAGRFAPESCPVACRQLAPDSDLLRELNDGDETPAGPRWVSIWSSADEIVTPPDTARLEGAVDVRVQSVCPDAQTVHGDLPTDPLVQGLVLRALDVTALDDAPTAGDCAPLRALGS